MEDNILPFDKKPKASLTRESQEDSTESRKLKHDLLDSAQATAPAGTVCVGFAAVFFYENKYAPGGAYRSLTAVGNLNEIFVDGGVKELARHTMQIFGRKPPRDIK